MRENSALWDPWRLGSEGSDKQVVHRGCLRGFVNGGGWVEGYKVLMTRMTSLSADGI